MKFRRFILALLVLALSISFLTVTASAAVKRPAAPELKVSNVASSGEIKLTWSKVEGAKNYQIYRASSKTGTFKKIKTTTAASFTNTAADPGDTYWYYVKAVSAKGIVSKNSNKVSATCKLPRPEVTLTNIASSGKITVSWKPVAGAQKYRVYRATSKNGTYTCLTTTAKTSLNNTSAVAGKVYYYKVKAMHANTAANSADSVVKSRICDLARPSIKLENVASSGKVKVSWGKVDGAVKYQVYRSLNQKKWILLKTTTSLSMVNNNGKAGTNYYYRVRAVAANTEANSAYSNVKNRMCDLPQPVLTLTNDAATGRVKLDWTAVDGAVEYKVYRCATKNGEYRWFMKTTETSCIDKTAEAEKTYYYKIQAVAANEEANSAQSAAKSGSFSYKAGLNLEISLDENGKPVLKWNEVKGAQSYEVYRAVDPKGKFILLGSTALTKYTNPGAGAGVTYYFQVKAIGSGVPADSQASAVKSITVAAPENEVLVTSYVASPNLYIYGIPSDTAKETILPYMEKVKVGEPISTTSSGSWVRVFYKDKLYYTWVPSDEEKFTTVKSSFSYTGNTQQQQDVIDLALKIYREWDVFYTNDDSSGIMRDDGRYGFDCSGYVSYILNNVMQKTIPTYRTSVNITTLYETSLLYNEGYPGEYCVEDVAIKNLQPGDILFFRMEKSQVDHCGIYLGNNEFVHCTEFWDGVCIMPLKESFVENFVAARRFIPLNPQSANTEMEINYGYVYLYADRSTEAEVLYNFQKGEHVTLLYTSSNGDWGYVRNASGQEGFALMKRLDRVG